MVGDTGPGPRHLGVLVKTPQANRHHNSVLGARGLARMKGRSGIYQGLAQTVSVISYSHKGKDQAETSTGNVLCFRSSPALPRSPVASCNPCFLILPKAFFLHPRYFLHHRSCHQRSRYCKPIDRVIFSLPLHLFVVSGPHHRHHQFLQIAQPLLCTPNCLFNTALLLVEIYPKAEPSVLQTTIGRLGELAAYRLKIIRRASVPHALPAVTGTEYCVLWKGVRQKATHFFKKWKTKGGKIGK